jgi:hypothetical protein
MKVEKEKSEMKIYKKRLRQFKENLKTLCQKWFREEEERTLRMHSLTWMKFLMDTTSQVQKENINLQPGV